MLTPLVYKLENITYSYLQGQEAIAGVNLEIAAGEKIVLLGPNGCGKSTLQKILAALVFPTAGKISIFDTVITRGVVGNKEFAAALRRKIGFVFQNSDAQIFCPSVLDEVMFGPLSMGMEFAEARRRAQELLDFVGISALGDRLPHHLSGGEKKKVAIAAVLAVNPEVLILDEPTNGLDPKTQRWILDMITELNCHNKTIITATHHLDLVPELAGRVVVMGENHNIIADGQPRDILQDRNLLLAANLIDERYHVHLHGEEGHVHVHKHIHDAK